MSGYVIRLTDPAQPWINGQYLSHGGTPSAWTPRLEEARVFPTREAADRERCVENEAAVSLASIFGR